MKRKIVVMNPNFHSSHKERLKRGAEELGCEIHFYTNTEEAAEDAVDAEILLGHRDSFLRCGKEARWICATSAGVNTFVKKGVIQRDDCILTNSSGAFGLTIAEHLIMVTLMLLRKMDYYQHAMREKRWPAYIPIRSISGSRITIAGTGDLGSSFARRLLAFGPDRICGINRSGKTGEPAFDRVISQEDPELGDLLKNTDILALCLPSTSSTAGFLSEDRIRLLHPGAYVINVGRGDAIDQEALVRALNEERIAGAALDVMVKEPIPENDPLWTAKNCLLTPHCSGNMSLDYTVEKIIDMFLEDLENYCLGRPMAHVVDRRQGY